VVLGVAVAPVAAPVAAIAPDHGAAGIGDPYFPLDGNGGIDVLRYDVHDRYSFAQGRLSGRTRVTLRATETLSGFNLDFLLPVTSVKVAGNDVRYDQRRFHELAIRHRVAEGERLELVVRYAGRPGRYSYAGESNWLANSQEVVAMNQPHMAPWWFPANDHPLDRARISIGITVPKDKTVVANGELAGREVNGGLATTTWRPQEPMVPYLAFFAAGDFRVSKGTDHGLPWVVAVSRHLPVEKRAHARTLLEESAEHTAWIQDVLGAPYPFSTTGGLATSLDPGFALENQTRPTYSPFSLDTATVVHELAHQWFGDHVAVEGWKDIWLNEGPATFFEAYYVETHGGEPGDDWLHRMYDFYGAGNDFWDHEPADPCPDNERCINSIFASFVYHRGAMALHALRNVIDDALGSDEAFFGLLGQWVTDRAGTTGSTAQFETLAEKVTGLELDAFFDVWLHTPSKPAETAANGL
jgi:aminopeptidase N